MVVGYRLLPYKIRVMSQGQVFWQIRNPDHELRSTSWTDRMFMKKEFINHKEDDLLV